ncbi:MAG TPA: hypothetical protein VFQ77_13975 [Pseudonocardiaceae bacterium]|jgi:hypothetical protein|nr:hypothetical protein [Pseudonocardiaceae bacterium]
MLIDIPLQMPEQVVGLIVTGGETVEGDQGLFDAQVFGEASTDRC